MDSESDILIESLTEYRIQGLALKRRNSKDCIMAMKFGLLYNDRNCPDMEANIFTRFLKKYPTIETSGKDQIVFPSDHVPSSFQEPNTYDNYMHTDFINPIRPISHSYDGSNVIFMFIIPLRGEISRGWLWVSITQRQLMMSAPNLRICLMEVLTRRDLFAQNYTATYVDREGKFDI